MPITDISTLYSNTSYVVDASEPDMCPYVTIQEAIDDTQLAYPSIIPAEVYIKPGTYTENLILYDGITLKGANDGQVIIIGTHLPPASGISIFENISFQQVGAGDSILESAAAGTTNISFTGCDFDTEDGYICDLASWTGKIEFDLCTDADSIDNGIINNAGAAQILIKNSEIGASDGRSLTVNGKLEIINSIIACPIALSGSQNSSFKGGSGFSGTITLSGTGKLEIISSYIVTGTDSAIVQNAGTQLYLFDSLINTSNVAAIDGTGTVYLYNVTFADSYAFAATIVEELSGMIMTGNIRTNACTREISNTIAATINRTYVNTNVGLTTITLPVLAPEGTFIEVIGESAGLWKIAQNAGQDITFGSLETTTGVTGYLAASNRYDTVTLKCRVADTTWSVVGSTGVLNVV